MILTEHLRTNGFKLIVNIVINSYRHYSLIIDSIYNLKRNYLCNKIIFSTQFTKRLCKLLVTYIQNSKQCENIPYLFMNIHVFILHKYMA